MSKGAYLLLFGALAASVGAVIVNDWTTPCFGGCAYDVSNSHLEAAVYISGDDTAVSDLTPAAGWTIIDCVATGRAQDIRAVCNSTDVDSPCNHLFQGGAVGTIVRLPEDCTDMQFARIAAVQTESAPDKRGPDASTPAVQVFSVDANFGAIDASQNGEVSFWVQTAGMPLAGSLDDAIPAEVMLVSGNVSGSGAPVEFNKYVTIYNKSINCPQSGDRPDLSGGVLVGFDAHTNTSLNYGVYAAGTVTPPNVTEFQLYAAFEGYIDGILNVNTTAGASIDSGEVPVYSAPIGDGIDVVGILQVGPVFTLYVEGTASIDVELNMAAGVNYTINNAEMYYPPSSNTTSGGMFQPGNTAVDLDGAPDITVDTTIAAHLIPTITFGIDALDGFVEAEIFLQFDASIDLLLDLEKAASISVANITGSKTKAEDSAFNGSVAVQGGLDVSAGANTSFFKLFGPDTTFPLFQKTFPLYQHSFGDSSPSKRDLTLAPRRVIAQRSDTDSTSGNNTITCSLD